MKVEIYGKEKCPNCNIAKNISENIASEIVMFKVEVDYTLPELFKKAGGRVFEFPQVFVDGQYIGGLKKYEEFLKTIKNKPSLDIDLNDLDDLEI